ncbi:hypothetical protein GCM10022234_35780 [Aeromicrobium panaciterrae]|uniref:hypothetical protein n=1 Tax=Aeromicrobium panaciterrae TaxID=363861 RepID=UPI0031E20EF9
MDWISVLVAAVTSVLGSNDLHWAGVLGELDDVRAEAFAHRDAALLDKVYAPGSSGRTQDASIISAYASRGARVTGADLVLLSCTVRSSSAEQVRLDVVDQLESSRIVWDDGTSRALPTDQPTRRVVTLIRTRDGWRID